MKRFVKTSAIISVLILPMQSYCQKLTVRSDYLIPTDKEIKAHCHDCSLRDIKEMREEIILDIRKQEFDDAVELRKTRN